MGWVVGVVVSFRYLLIEQLLFVCQGENDSAMPIDFKFFGPILIKFLLYLALKFYMYHTHFRFEPTTTRHHTLFFFLQQLNS